MPGLLKSVPVTDEQRRAHDRHRPLIVVAVLAVLAVYVYLFTQAADPVGLRLPAELAFDLGIQIPHVFDDDGNVSSNVQISLTREFRSDDERLILFAAIAAAFLCAYFLPLRYKQASLVLWATLAIGVLYGIEAIAGLLLSHLVVYGVLHPDRRRGLPISAAAGVAAWLAFAQDAGGGPERLAWLAGLVAVSVAFYRFALLPLLALPRVAPVLQAAAVHAAILAIAVGVLAEGDSGDAWRLPLGILMFFWQWARLAMYHVDYRDEQVPRDLPLDRYLAVFLSPGVIPNWSWGVTIPQGYAYLNNNFLSRDKNAVIVDGIRLLGVALLYLVFWDWLRNLASHALESLGIPVFRCNTRFLVKHFVNGGQVGTLSVLLTTLLDLARFMLFFGSIMHFKVGVWRLFGYDVASYYNRPWKATNLVALWGRYAFHFREFLVRVFYYPSFFTLFRRYRNLRVFTASMMAACMGNFIWHISERSFFREISVENLRYVVGTWPYFVLLGLGIASYQLFRMWRKPRRKPWSWDAWIVSDVLAVYCTLQFFGLIHIFMRPASGGTHAELWRLFLIGLGIHLPG